MAESKFEDMERSPYFDIKVHRLMCLELRRLINRIVSMFVTIESARPGGSSAVQALCLLHAAVDRANMLIQHCSESSKLYLALTGERMLSKCKKLRDKFALCLSRIQTMVPLVLAAEISKILDELRAVNFFIESTERDAGQAILGLLRRGTTAADSRGSLEFSMLFTACGALSISSPLALLIEKRSIKKLLLKLQRRESVNTKILSYLLYLLRKYGKSVLKALESESPREESRREGSASFVSLGEESRREGSASFVSLGSSDTKSLLDSLEIQTNDSISQQLLPLDDKDLIKCYHSTGSYNTELAFLTKLPLLPWRLQCEVVEDVKERLRSSENASKVMLSGSQIESLVQFLREAGDLSDVKARGDGLEVLLAVSNTNSGETSDTLGDVAHTITEFFRDPAMTSKSLELLDIVSRRQHFKSVHMVSGFLPFILTALDSRVREHEALSLRILQNLSSCCGIKPHLLYLDVLPRLVCFLTDPELRQHSIEIIRSLCNTQEGRAAAQSILNDSTTAVGSSSIQMETAEELCRILAQETDDGSVSGTSDSNPGSRKKRFSLELFTRLRRKVLVLLKPPSRLLAKLR